MREMKHTPGPWWSISDPYENGLPYARFKGGDGLYDDETDKGFEFTGIMSEADRKLITAAPEMLAALKDLTLAYKALRQRAGYDEGDASDSLDAAEDAIAKAERRS